MENDFEIVCGVRPIKNDTPSTGKANLCHNILITQSTKNICLHGKPFLTREGRALARDIHRGPGGWPLAEVARG